MSSHSYSTPCPACGGDMDECTDNRPFNRTSGWCLSCGFQHYNRTSRMSLEEINDQRDDQELDVLTQEEYNKHTKEVEQFVKDYS